MPPVKKQIKKEEEVKENKFSVLRHLLSLNANKPPLEFGVNLNCRLIKIDNTPRVKEGETLKKNTFLTFAKYNSKNEIIGQTEFSFFNLDPESKFTFDNFTQQVSQLTTLCNIYNSKETYDPIDELESLEELEEMLKSPKSCKALQEKMYDKFSNIVLEYIGVESPLLAVKIVTDKTGKYLQLPREDKFCGLISEDYSFLKITPYELKMKEAALKPQLETADEKGEAPDKNASKSKLLNNL
jgi:hypothetical protein